jgi:hypothetical protein
VFTTTARGTPKARYYMGAYMFSAFWPYEILAVSTVPISTHETYTTKMLWKLETFYDYVVYPAGLVLSENRTQLILSYGYQDVQSRIITLDVKGLIESLTIIERKNRVCWWKLYLFMQLFNALLF